MQPRSEQSASNFTGRPPQPRRKSQPTIFYERLEAARACEERALLQTPSENRIDSLQAFAADHIHPQLQHVAILEFI